MQTYFKSPHFPLITVIFILKLVISTNTVRYTIKRWFSIHFFINNEL